MQTAKLCVPVKVLDQHAVALGKTGSGKSSVLRHFAEDLLAAKKRVCIVDPKGDWYGLKSSADGKSAGFEIVAFGAFKNPDASDIPLNSHSGKHVAELVATGNRPCMIGFRGWMPGEMADFWIDFASTLFSKNEGELFLIIDEVHNFAPKGKIMDPKAGKVLHWTNRLLSEGRGLGLTILIASQRPQKVHNDTLTCCETLIGMRVVHAADRAAIEAWIEGCGDDAYSDKVLGTLAQMGRGEAWVWSPEIGFGPTRIQFPMFRTFDSFAPPQLQKKVSNRGWSSVDLAAVKEKMAAVIKEAEENDPAVLKRKIRELMAHSPNARDNSLSAKINEKRVEQAINTAKAPLLRLLRETMKVIATINAIEIEGLDPEKVKHVLARAAKEIGQAADAQMQARQKELVRLQQRAAELVSQIAKAIGDSDKDIAVAVSIKSPNKPEPRAAIASEPRADGKLGEGELKILRVVLQYKGQATTETIAVATGYKETSRRTYLQRLGSAGLVVRDGEKYVATEDGERAAGDYEPLPTGDELRKHWLETLPEGESKILAILIAAYPDRVSSEQIEEQTQYKETSRRTYIQRLSARQLVDNAKEGAKASEILFE